MNKYIARSVETLILNSCISHYYDSLFIPSKTETDRLLRPLCLPTWVYLRGPHSHTSVCYSLIVSFLPFIGIGSDKPSKAARDGGSVDPATEGASRSSLACR